MSKAAFEAKLAAIDALKTAEADASRDTALAKALRDRNNYIAAKAARVAGEVGARNLLLELIAAFHRFLTGGAKADPQCWAKLAIVKALSALGHQDPDVYLLGLRHVQMEKVWGGEEDTAASVRAACTSALIDCRGISDFDVLQHLIEPLYDRDKSVRASAAHSIGRIDRPEAALILRCRALAGDPEPEPLGAVYSALLAIEGSRALAFVATFLRAGQDAAHEAALAIGATHEPLALEMLRAGLRDCPDQDLRRSLLAAVALTRLPEAFDFLIDLVESGSREAREALRDIPLPDAHQVRLQAVAQ